MGNQACCEKSYSSKKEEGEVFLSNPQITNKKQSTILQQEKLDQLNENQIQQIRIRKTSIYKIQLPTGSVYQGQIKNNLPHGKGVQIHQEDEIYDGMFVQGKKQGFGKYKYSNGLIYQGQFRNNSMDGKGKLIWPCGDVYEGEFRDNMMHGQGIYTMAGGQGYYKGQYKGGKKHGYGEMKMKDLTYQGVWNEGVYMNSVVGSKLN